MGRMIESYSHQRPWYYYSVQIWWQLFPWSVFLPLAAYKLKKNEDLRKNAGIRFLLVWFLTVFLFFTFISGKRSQYLMPLLPAGGLLLGWALINAKPGAGRLRERKAFSIPLAVAALISGAGIAVSVPYVYYHANRSLIPAIMLVAAFWAILVVASLVCRDRPPKTALAWVIATNVLAVACVYGYLAPVADDFMSASPFCTKALAAASKTDRMLFYRVYRPNIQFYMNRTIPRVDTEEALRQALDASNRLLVIMQTREQDSLTGGIQCKYDTLASARIGSRDMVCLALWR
jgi:4-amino-4-deoxy-L-arabinose transferase-like glycosyltransferase